MNLTKHQRKTKQAEKFRKCVRLALVQRDLSVSALAAQIGFPRSSVSKAINQGTFPRIGAAIASNLGLSFHVAA